MYDFNTISKTQAQFCIDTQLYSQTVVSKILYWLNSEFVVSAHKCEDCIKVMLETKHKECDWMSIKQELSQQFSDYNLREIIEAETKDIRTVLYVKAFANLDDFEEYGD